MLIIHREVNKKETAVGELDKRIGECEIDKGSYGGESGYRMS